MTTRCTETFHQDGYVILNGFLTGAEMDEILLALESAGAFNYTIPVNLSAIPAIHTLLHLPRLLAAIEEVIGNHAQLTNSIILNKTKDNNWGLDWHQDTKVAVSARIDAPIYTGWTIEQGIHHAILPAQLYSQNLYMRLHLDDCGSHNGGIWMLPGTHKLGIVPQEEIQDVVAAIPIVQCEAKRGDVMLMHPLLLHKSPYSLSGANRRILQAGYTTLIAEKGTEWK